jgi:general secretion pathway protein A
MPMPQADVAAFRLTPDLRFLFLNDNCETAFAALCAGVQRGDRLLLLTGPFGVGKSLLLRRMEGHLASIGVRAAYVAYPKLDFDELLAWSRGTATAERPVAGAARGAETGAAGKGSRAPRVVLLDDADRCSTELLAALQGRLASMERGSGVQLVLAGSPQLADRLRHDFPDLQQLVRVHAALEPFDSAQADAYIRHRLNVSGRTGLALATEARNAVFRYSRGIPRMINHACARALLLAGPEESVVSQDLAREAIDDYIANTSFGQAAAILPPALPAANAAPAPTIRETEDPAPAAPALAESAPEPPVPRAEAHEEPAPPSTDDRAAEAPARDMAAVPTPPPMPATEPEPTLIAEPDISIPLPPGPLAAAPRPETPPRPGPRRPTHRLHLVDRRRAAEAQAPRPATLTRFAGFRPRRASADEGLAPFLPPQVVPAPAAAGRAWLRGLAVAIACAAIAAAVLVSRPHLLDSTVAMALRKAASTGMADARDAAAAVRREFDRLVGTR